MTRRVKVVAHVHSDWSYDASWSLPRIAQAFARRGYKAVLMAEHDRGFDQERWLRYRGACAAASTPSTLLVPGIEYADREDVVHIPVWGDVPFLGSAQDVGTVLRGARDEGGFAVFAHPWRRRAWERMQDEWLESLAGIEIWNRKYDGWAPNREVAALARKAGVAPFVSLDFHGRRQFFPLSLAIDVEGAVTNQSISSALHAGRFEALAFSTSALRFTDGLAGQVLASLEMARRRTAQVIRRASR